ncbi:MAG: hypothetical protein HUU29_06390 [Planctomycetaceae bacterium]|nr:hypothetical protein [Planctomycetaceae bacterium]
MSEQSEVKPSSGKFETVLIVFGPLLFCLLIVAVVYGSRFPDGTFEIIETHEDEAWSQAQAVGIDYEDLKEGACEGDEDAIIDLLELTPYTDAAGAFSHTLHLYEVLKASGDHVFANAINKAHMTKSWRWIGLKDWIAGDGLGYDRTFDKTKNASEVFEQRYPLTSKAFDHKEQAANMAINAKRELGQ